MADWNFLQSIKDAAEAEAMASPLPGVLHGPADAYRHLIGAAELRRRFGYGLASTALAANEVFGTHIQGYSAASRQMDEHNNAIGLSIGAEARSYEDVVRRARAAIDSGIARGGTGEEGTPLWPSRGWSEREDRPSLDRRLPVQWPETIPSATGYRFGEERFSIDRALRAGTPRQREVALLERLEATPTAEWSEADVKAVIGSTPYRNSNAPTHATWRSRVRQYFEERATSEESGGDDGAARECGGIAAVRAYTRMGPSGPIQVGAHSRTIPCG